MQVKKQQLEPDMEQQTSSKLGKECIKAVYCYHAYLTSWAPKSLWTVTAAMKLKDICSLEEKQWQT